VCFYSALDSISKNFGPVRVDVLGKIAEAVLGGLTYLYRTHRIMHRDIKPSNIVVNSKGQIKLCDFGVSSELEGSVADTFVGTGTYMAPERIKGAQYTIHSDVWSFGLTLMELAIGKFPFNNSDNDEHGGPQSILDLLQQIVMEPAPKLPKSDAFPLILEQIVEKCLIKEPKQRPTPEELYVRLLLLFQSSFSAAMYLPSAGNRSIYPSREAHPSRSRRLGRQHDGPPQPQIPPHPPRNVPVRRRPPTCKRVISFKLLINHSKRSHTNIHGHGLTHVLSYHRPTTLVTIRPTDNATA
jgi:serine/threonine protein kinase